MSELVPHAVVALLENLSEHGLVRGHVGTVVEVWAPGVYEVEFCGDDGRTYAMAAVPGDRLMRLHHKPVHRTKSEFVALRKAAQSGRSVEFLRRAGETNRTGPMARIRLTRAS